MTDYSHYSDEDLERAAGLPVSKPAPIVAAGPYDHMTDEELERAAGGPSAVPPAPSAPQMEGLMREPALAASNVAKGAVNTGAGLMDASGTINQTQGQAFLNVMDNLFGDGKDVKPLPSGTVGVAQGDADAARKAGIIDRPELEPQGIGERLLAAGSQGVGGSLLFPTELPAAGMNMVRGFTGGAGSEVGHELFPNSTLAPLAFGLAAGAAPDAISSVASVGRNALGLYDPANRANSIIASKLTADKIDPAEINQTLAANPDKPLTIADMGGPATQRIARASLDVPSDGSASATQMLQDRDAGQGVNGPYDMFKQGGTADRVVDNIKTALGSDDAFKTSVDLMAKQQQDAGPLYDAFRAQPPVPARQVQTFMSSPTFRGAVSRANTAILDEGGKPLTDLITFNEAGDPISVKGGAFPPDTLDRIKQGLDDSWLSAKASGDAGAARTANTLRSRYLQFLDTKYPDTYPQARQAFAGPAVSLDALKQGAEIFKTAPQDVASTLQALPPESQPMFRIGVQQALISKVQNTADGANEVRALFGNPAKRDSIAAAFDNPSALNQLSQNLGVENRMFQTKGLLGGSRTAPSALDQADLAKPGLGEFGDAAAHAAGGNFIGAGMKMLSPLFSRLGGAPNEETSSLLAQKLLNPNAQQNAQTMALVQALMGQAPKQGVLPAALPGLLAGPLSQSTGQ